MGFTEGWLGEVRVDQQYLADLDRQIDVLKRQVAKLERKRAAALTLLDDDTPIHTVSFAADPTTSPTSRNGLVLNGSAHRGGASLAVVIERILRDGPPLTPAQLRAVLVEQGYPGAKTDSKWTHFFGVLRSVVDERRVERRADGRYTIGPEAGKPEKKLQERAIYPGIRYWRHILELLREAKQPLPLDEISKRGNERYGYNWTPLTVRWAIKRHNEVFENYGKQTWGLREWPDDLRVKHMLGIRAIGARNAESAAINGAPLGDNPPLKQEREVTTADH